MIKINEKLLWSHTKIDKIIRKLNKINYYPLKIIIIFQNRKNHILQQYPLYLYL